ncbi:MAG: hypothetical protein IKV25_02355 [Clostridia bacterium]|nr:hypothetical protein [Clostridia bacterium]
MKKFLSLLIATVIFALSFSSCSQIAKVRVNGTKIDNEVYYYFEDLYKKDKVQIKQAISRYVAINSEFSAHSLTLSSTQKSELSKKVNDLWHIYSVYYSNIGISKQTIYKIETSKFYEDTLLDYYYGPEGQSPVDEESIKKYFKENYIAINFATDYLFNINETGAMVSMSDSEKASIINNLSRSADLVNTGSLIETTTDREIHNTIINSSSDGSFPTGFYKEVEKLEVNGATTIIIGDYIFLVQRIDVFDETYNYYGAHRTECLRAMKGNDFNALVDQWSQNYKVN